MIIALGAVAIAASSNQEVTSPTTRIWLSGFGFHCNECGGNGATAVIYQGDDTGVIKAIGNIKKQPAGSMVVEKGDQKDIFGTKTYPIALERVGDTTLWNLITGDDIKCATCGRTDWVTYSNNSGVIEGKNIQAHHPPLPVQDPDPDPDPVDPDLDVPYGGLSFAKKVAGVNIVDWLDDKGYSKGEIEAILNGLKFYLVNSDNVKSEPAVVDVDNGVYTFAKIPVGTYTLTEEITGAAIGIFKALKPIDNIIIIEDEMTALVLGGTIKGNIAGPDIKDGDLFQIINGYGRNGYNSATNGLGLGANSQLLNNNGDLFYIGVTNGRANFDSFCAFAGAHWFANDGGGIGIGYMVAQSIKDLAYLRAFNYIVDNYYGDDFGTFADSGKADQSFARKVAQTVVWSLLGQIDPASDEFKASNLTKEQQAAVIATLAAVADGYVGNGSVIDVVYMVGVDAKYEKFGEKDFINCQPQIAPIFGTFFVENEPEDDTGIKDDNDIEVSVSFLKTKYSGLLNVAKDEFSFELFSGGSLVGTFTTDSGGTVTMNNLVPGSYVIREVLSASTEHAVGNGEFGLVWKALYPKGADGLYFTIDADGAVDWRDGDNEINNVYINKTQLLWAPLQGFELEHSGQAVLSTTGEIIQVIWLDGTSSLKDAMIVYCGTRPGVILFPDTYSMLGSTLNWNALDTGYEITKATCTHNIDVFFPMGAFEVHGTALGHDYCVLTEDCQGIACGRCGAWNGYWYQDLGDYYDLYFDLLDEQIAEGNGLAEYIKGVALNFYGLGEE